MTLGQRWELDARMLPTGKHQILTEQEEAMKGAGVYPFFEAYPSQRHKETIDVLKNRLGLTELMMIKINQYREKYGLGPV